MEKATGSRMPRSGCAIRNATAILPSSGGSSCSSSSATLQPMNRRPTKAHLTYPTENASLPTK